MLAVSLQVRDKFCQILDMNGDFMHNRPDKLKWQLIIQ